MRLLIVCLAALALLFASSATACPPVDPDGGGSFSSFGAGYGADACAAPMAVAGNFGVGAYGGGYGGGAMFAAPSYSASFAAPVYSAPLVQRQVFASPAYGYGASFAAPVRVRSFGYGVGRRFGGFGVGSYGGAVVAAPVVHTRAFAAPAYGAAVVAPPVVAVPVRAPGPIRGAFQGFRAGLRNRLNGF
jgi:hypothetical protein